MLVNAIWLATNGGNEHIEALLASGDLRLDRLKLGPWMGEEGLTAIAAKHSALLHISDGVIWPRGRQWVAEQVRLVRLVDAPWLSVHLDIGWILLAYHWRGPSPILPALARLWAVRTLRRLRATSPVPVLAENMPRWERTRPAYVVDPAFITAVVEEAGCGFLLDLAHARVAAAMRREPARQYIARLPLDRLVEIHVSGPRPWPAKGRSAEGRYAGPLFDAHQPLQEEDYALLAWVLERARPRAVTLEYYREREPLEIQLRRLRAMLDEPY
jgi:uncharacterized protein (UPF0276 family)